MNQIHKTPPTEPTELLYKNNEKVKRRIQIHTHLRYFHRFDTEMTLNRAPVHWLFVFSFFQFSIILINTRSVIRRIVIFYLSDSDFRTFESEFWTFMSHCGTFDPCFRVFERMYSVQNHTFHDQGIFCSPFTKCLSQILFFL